MIFLMEVPRISPFFWLSSQIIFLIDEDDGVGLAGWTRIEGRDRFKNAKDCLYSWWLASIHRERILPGMLEMFMVYAFRAFLA